MESRTQRARIKDALRRLFLRSRERASALKRDGYCCQECGIKQCKAAGHVVKVEVHHKEGILEWDKMISLIQEQLLCSPEHLQTLCKECHRKEKN